MKDIVYSVGTKVTMKISKNSKVNPEDIFNQYTDEDFAFTKNALFLVEPYKISAGAEPVSRSEAKRFLAGAEKFKHILIDFKNTERIGQGFADEVFRVFQNQYPHIFLEPIHSCPAVLAMIKHVKSK